MNRKERIERRAREELFPEENPSLDIHKVREYRTFLLSPERDRIVVRRSVAPYEYVSDAKDVFEARKIIDERIRDLEGSRRAQKTKAKPTEKNYGQNIKKSRIGDKAREYAVNDNNYKNVPMEEISEKFRDYHQNSSLRYDLEHDKDYGWIVFRVYDDNVATLVKNFLSDVYDDAPDLTRVELTKDGWYEYGGPPGR